MGGFTAPLVADRVPVAMMVLVAAMTPTPGESPGEWWTNTGHAALHEAAFAAAGGGRRGRVPALFLHDVPADVIAEFAEAHLRNQSGTPFEKPWPLEAWPDVPTRFLLCRDDRFFPPEFQRRIVRDRLGFAPDEMDSGHLPALAHPASSPPGWRDIGPCEGFQAQGPSILGSSSCGQGPTARNRRRSRCGTCC